MCDVCLRTPCDSRCPNAPEPPVFAKCENCGHEIHDGDDYYSVGEHIYCVDCVQIETAEVDEYEYED